MTFIRYSLSGLIAGQLVRATRLRNLAGELSLVSKKRSAQTIHRGIGSHIDTGCLFRLISWSESAGKRSIIGYSPFGRADPQPQ